MNSHKNAKLAPSEMGKRLAARSLPLRLRDAACWLFSPYL